MSTEPIPVLRRYATGEITHLDRGSCPIRFGPGGAVHPPARDPECEVCRALDATDVSTRPARHGNGQDRPLNGGSGPWGERVSGDTPRAAPG